MKYIFLFIFVLFPLFAGSKIYPGCEDQDCALLKRPYLLKGQVQIYKRPNKEGRVIASIKKGDVIKDLRLYTKLINTGRAKILKINNLPKLTKTRIGDTVQVLMYMGHGWYKIRVEDSEIMAHQQTDERFSFEILSSPLTESWALVKTKHGTGWIYSPLSMPFDWER